MKGSITLKPSDDPRPIASGDKSLNQIGFIEYFEGHSDDVYGTIKPQYSIWALVPRSQFNDLVTALRGGRVPASIWIDIEGLTLPTEFSMQWDNKAKKRLPMASIQFSIPVAYSQTIDDPDNDQELLDLMPVTRADLKGALATTTQLTDRISAKLNWLLAGMAIVVIFLLVRYL